ncbi:MAG: 50S ribosomal protein L9 [Halofilum sp. (in: g-proteobacteria)]
MQVILVQNVGNLGKLGDVVRVKPGYARNYLVPHGIARAATPENVKAIEARRVEFEREEAAKMESAKGRHAQLDGRRITLQARVGAEGKLFGSVSAGDIADALTADGVEVEKRELRLPEGPLRETGEFEIGVHVYSDLDATVTVVVEAEA